MELFSKITNFTYKISYTEKLNFKGKFSFIYKVNDELMKILKGPWSLENLTPSVSPNSVSAKGSHHKSKSDEQSIFNDKNVRV